MDHGHMGRGGMDHGGMDHGDMGNMCSMNMLFTWSTENLCIVFPQWRVTGTLSLILSILAVIAMTAGYEWVREMARKYETSSQEYVNRLPIEEPEDNAGEQRSWRSAGKLASEAVKNSKTIKAVFYAVQVFYSFFIMLLFMTYNGWIMLAVAVGAFVGHMAFGADTATKDVSCH